MSLLQQRLAAITDTAANLNAQLFELNRLRDRVRKAKRSARRSPSTKPTESKCPACNGTGYPVVMQPVRPGRKIYSAPCTKCGGKGRITNAPN